MSRRLYNAILKKNRVLTYDSRYFQLCPLDKRLYEIARAHVGDQLGFKMGIEKLQARVGSTVSLRHFKAELVKISKRAGKDLQAQGPAPRLRPEPDRSAPPALARSQEAGADREDAAEVLPGAFLPDRPAVVPASGQPGADA